MADIDICPHLDKATYKKVSERFWAVSEVPQAMWCGVEVRNWKAFLISVALGSSAHGT